MHPVRALTQQTD